MRRGLERDNRSVKIHLDSTDAGHAEHFTFRVSLRVKTSRSMNGRHITNNTALGGAQYGQIDFWTYKQYQHGVNGISDRKHCK
jgi:hypothetical protein